MQKHYSYLTIDLGKKIYNKIKVVQGDIKSRYIVANLISNNTYYDLSDCTVKVYGIKKDNTKIFNSATIIDAKQGQFEIELTNQALAISGDLKLQILILGASRERLTSFSFFIEVVETIVDDAAIESTNEFGALLEGLSKLDEWDKYFKETSEKIEEKYTERLNSLDKKIETTVSDMDVKYTGKINNLNKQVDTTSKQLTKDNISNPIYLNTLTSQTSSVMQMFLILQDKRYIFSQVVKEENGKESFVTNLCDEHGNFISSMKITEGGHGVITGYEENGQVIILFTDNNGIIRKCTYAGGTTISVSDAAEIPKYSSEYQLVNVNKELNLISVMNKNVQNKYYSGYVYALDEYLAGSATTKFTVNDVMEENQTLQGFGCDDKYFYVYTGYPAEQLMIRKHDLTTQTYEDININISSPSVLEGEGLFINGNNIYIGICKGEPTALRSNDIYSITSLENLISNVANTINNAQTYQLCEGDGGAKSIALPSKLSDITQPGTYYFTTEQFKSFADIPGDYTINSGFFMNVSAKAKDGTVIQELIRNTTGTDPFRCMRRVGTGEVNEWIPTTPEMRAIFQRDTRKETTINLPDSLWNYDILLFQVWAPNGKWNTATVRTSILQKEKSIVFNGLNIGDNSSSKTVYAYELHVEIDDTGKILTQSIKNEVVLSSPSENVRRECSVGVYSIQGLKGINFLPSL